MFYVVAPDNSFSKHNTIEDAFVSIEEAIEAQNGLFTKDWTVDDFTLIEGCEIALESISVKIKVQRKRKF